MKAATIAVVATAPAVVWGALEFAGKQMLGALLLVVLIGLLGYVAAWVSLACPSCSKPIGAAALNALKRGANRVNRCPRCGISFDAPWP